MIDDIEGESLRGIDWGGGPIVGTIAYIEKSGDGAAASGWEEDGTGILHLFPIRHSVFSLVGIWRRSEKDRRRTLPTVREKDEALLAMDGTFGPEEGGIGAAVEDIVPLVSGESAPPAVEMDAMVGERRVKGVIGIGRDGRIASAPAEEVDPAIELRRDEGIFIAQEKVLGGSETPLVLCWAILDVAFCEQDFLRRADRETEIGGREDWVWHGVFATAGEKGEERQKDDD